MDKDGSTQQGFALAFVIVISLVLILIGGGIFYIVNSRFSEAAAENKNEIAENLADWGINQIIEALANGTQTCNGSVTLTSLTGGTVNVRLVRSGPSCFIWSSANFSSAKSIKIGVITINDVKDYAPFVFKNLTYFGAKSKWVVESCDPLCTTPAMVLGNTLTIATTGGGGGGGGGGGKLFGFLSNATPVVEENADLTDIYPSVFGATILNLSQLLDEISTSFDVTFSSNDTPVTIAGTNEWYPPAGVTGFSCTADVTISCLINGTNVTFTPAANGSFLCSLDNKYYDALNFKGGSLTVYTLSGGKVLADNVTISATSQVNNATIVGRNALEIDGGVIYNASILAGNLTVSLADIKDSFIYSGGSYANIDFYATGGIGGGGGSLFTIGNLTDPNVWILNAEQVSFNASKVAVYGLVFVTENAQSVEVNFLKKARFYGAFLSNSLSNTIYTWGAAVNFSSQVINTLALKYSFIAPAPCGRVIVKAPLLFTKISTY